jgi:endonuclease YncB( thermonuclease family)
MTRGLTRSCTALAAGALAALLTGGAQAAEPLSGTATVLDGDTLELGHLRIRLHGIDAPELDQTCGTADGDDWPCGLAARDRLAALVDGHEIGCRPRERDGFGRVVARCYVGGDDLGARLVAEGLGWAYVRFSLAYAEAEAEARAAGRGIWQGAAQAAWHHRAGGWRPAAGRTDAAPAPTPAPATPPDGCGIKGNISARGERVYHLPGSRWYGRTILEATSGERWFCTAAEAETAGWRPAAATR